MGNLASVTKRRKASQPPTKNDRTTGDSEISEAEHTILVLGKGWMLPPALSAKLTDITVGAGLDGFETPTIMKQMKVIHQGGFSVEERIAYRVAIYKNLLENARAIAFTMNKLSIKPVELQTRVRPPCPSSCTH